MLLVERSVLAPMAKAAQTLKALANHLQSGQPRGPVSHADYFKHLSVYTKTHRKDGRPYIAEGADPDTGSWEGYDSPGHSDHYFHSGYVDLIVTGLIGLRPRDDDTIEVHPLAPEDWDYFAIDDLPYRGHRLSILWDRDGRRYGRGPGLQVLADGRSLASSPRLERLTAPLVPIAPVTRRPPSRNYAVNNDGDYYPRVTASYSSNTAPIAKVVDGNTWYHIQPPNRWISERSMADSDWVALDFGIPRRIDTVKLYPLDDGQGITAPSRIDLEFWDGRAMGRDSWPVARSPAKPTGHRANVIHFPERTITKLRRPS